MKVYLAFVKDRHVDADAEVFASADAAIGYAKKTAREFARFPEDYEESEVEGWLFYAQYSVESDCVWVVEKTLKETAS